jgi:ABC-type transport system substrate-binding protein
MKRNVSRLFCVVLSAALMLTACSGGKSTGEGGQAKPADSPKAAKTQLVYAQAGGVNNLDTIPGPTTYPAGYEVSMMIYEGLVTFDDQMTIQPQLAESWKVSDDGLTWTFKLKSGVKFHDGTDFNAEAAKKVLDRLVDPKRNPANRTMWDPITEVKAVDPTTLQIITKTPHGVLLNALAHGTGGMFSPTAQEKAGDQFGLKPIGTGPYKLEKFTPNQEVVLTRNDQYWGTKPAYEKVDFKAVPDAAARISMLETGEADVIASVPPQDVARLKSNDKLSVIDKPGLRTTVIGFNLTKEPWNDQKVRQALNYAINRDAIIKSQFLGMAVPLTGPLAPNTVGYVKSGEYTYNPDKAKQLLAEAGWKDLQNGVLVKNGQPLKMVLNTAEGQYPKDLQVVEAVSAQLKQIGVDVQIQKVEAASRWDVIKVPPKDVKYDAYIWAFNPSNGDGGTQLDANFKSNANPSDKATIWNMSFYSNAQVDKYLTDAAQITDPVKRTEVLGKAGKIIWDEAPAIFLYVDNVVVAQRKEVSGVQVWPVIFTILRTAKPAQ